jgi:xanthine dehydrogenase accessory factor
LLVLVIGGGDLGTGVAHRLHVAGLRVVISELPQPTVIRRTVSFASAIYDGAVVVDGVEAERAGDLDQARRLLSEGKVAVLADPDGRSRSALKPDVIVDARMAKRNTGTSIADAPIVVALGPGFAAGIDAHAVIETCRGHYLGRVLLQGRALPDTRVPGVIKGQGRNRVLRSPCRGVLRVKATIGQVVEEGDVVAFVEGIPITARVSGAVRGLLHEGLIVTKDQKIGDIDPRGAPEYCFTISDKSRAVAGGVLEAILRLGGSLLTETKRRMLPGRKEQA